MEKVSLDLGKNSYEIFIGDKTLDNINIELDKIKKYKKILLISNDKVGPIYSERVIKTLEKTGAEVSYFEIKDGEKYKRIETVLPIYDFMVEKNFDRSSLIVSLGGGVVCDLTGYVAATFMRGVDFIQVPTSLLAQVDASIGGKVAVNHPKGKNLIGAFYQPKMVYIDVDVLNTLEFREVKTGLAEIVKHSVIWSKEYFDYLDENSKKILELETDIIIKIIKTSCEIKAEVVSQDEREQGIRALLNYGHTYGHVVENLTAYEVYRHGEAVIYGMIFAAELAKKLNLVDDSFINTQKELFRKFEMDIEIPKYKFETVLKILKHDKKVKNGKLIFVVPNKIGKAEIIKVEEKMIKEIYDSIEGKEVKGVIDIGTNTTRLFVAEVKDGKIINKYKKYMEITRLGESVDKTRVLKDEAIKRTVNTIEKYKEYAESFGVKELKAVATSAARDAKNSLEFLEASKKVGVEIDLISGKDEGKFAFNGVLSDDYKPVVTVIDIGGGSTEFIKGTKGNIEFVKSIDLGSVRVNEKFFSNEDYEENLDKAKIWICEKLESLDGLKDENLNFVGVAGTITSQVSILKELEIYKSEEIHRYELTIDEVNENLLKLSKMTMDERKNLKGLNPKRADVIVAGTFVLKTIMDYFDIKKITVSENDILEGLMLS